MELLVCVQGRRQVNRVERLHRKGEEKEESRDHQLRLETEPAPLSQRARQKPAKAKPLNSILEDEWQ
jgi:hypothetical protein